MKQLISILLLLCFAIQSEAQIQLDSIQIERLAITCQLWGHLKYFHPYLDDQSINWEKAFTDNIDDVIKSSTKQEFKGAIQRMLLELHDPLTTVTETTQGIASSDGQTYPTITYIEDSILLFSIRDYRDLANYNHCKNQFMILKERIPKSSGIIFDIRNQFELTDELKGWLATYFPSIESYLSDKPLDIPGFRLRYHDGFAPELGSTSGGYSSGIYVKGARLVQPSSNPSSNKVVFIANRFSELPRSAIALQKAGQGIILSSDIELDALFDNTVNLKLEDNLQAQLRQGELAIDHELAPDYVLPEGKKDKEIYDVAMQFLNGKKKSDVEFTTNVIENKNIPLEFHALSGEDVFYPDVEHRILAAAKIWTVIEYFFAYKELMDDDWDQVLKEYIPRFVNASDSLEYHLTVAEMYRYIQDGHGFIRSKVLSTYFGTASPPIKIRFIENQPVVVDIFPDSTYVVKGVEEGDVITHIDGEDVASVLNRRMKYRSSSNISALYNYLSRDLLNGNDSTTVAITVKKRDGQTEIIDLPRYNRFSGYGRKLRNGRNNEPMIRLLNNEIGYADLDRLMPDMVDSMFEEFKSTKAIIFDMRGYPNSTAWTIAPHLTREKNIYAANFKRYAPMHMKVGQFIIENFSTFNQAIPAPKPPFYEGITVMLIDERTQSQAEHTGLFFEAANQTKFIGSQTAGADGDVTNFQIPGNITLYFSGHDVRYADGRQLQKIGLVPEVEVKPTIKGIRNGRDEVLESAIEYVNSMLGKM